MERSLKADSVLGLDHLYQRMADATVAVDAARDQLIRTERRVRGDLAAAAPPEDNEVFAAARLDAAVNAHPDYQDAWATARDLTDALTKANAELHAAMTRLRLREVEAVEANVANWATLKG